MGSSHDINRRRAGNGGAVNHFASGPEDADSSDSSQPDSDAAKSPKEFDAEGAGEAAKQALAHPGQTRLALPPSSGGLVYAPRLRQISHSQFQICGRREVPGLIPWGFWGGLLLAFVGYFLITGSQGFWSLWDILWALVALTVGLLLFRFGRRSSRRLGVLCVLDFERELIIWPVEQQASPNSTQNSIGSGDLVLNFDEIEEIVFAMIDYPLSKDDIEVHAFTLLVRYGGDQLVPIIEATPAKEDAHEIAKMLASQLRLNISYVGNGF